MSKRDNHDIPTNLPLIGKTLNDILTEGKELKPLNGHVHFSKLGLGKKVIIVGRVSDFNVDTNDLDPSQNYLVTFNSEPNSDSRYFVKKVNAYNLRIDVKDPD